MNIIIERYDDRYRDQVLKVWEASVRDTHDFLHAEDIDFYKAIVETIDFNQFDVRLALSEHDGVIGFIGVAENRLEMLFLRPDYRGKGIGKVLTRLAIDKLNVTEVDVNEGNTNAWGFTNILGLSNTTVHRSTVLVNRIRF